MAEDDVTARKSELHWGTWRRQRDIGALTRMEPASVGRESLANGTLEDGGSFYRTGSAHVKN